MVGYSSPACRYLSVEVLEGRYSGPGLGTDQYIDAGRQCRSALTPITGIHVVLPETSLNRKIPPPLAPGGNWAKPKLQI